MTTNFMVILVDSTSHALRIEKTLAKYKKNSKLIPVPRHLSSDCGVCVRIAKENCEEILAIIKAQALDYRSIEEI